MLKKNLILLILLSLTPVLCLAGEAEVTHKFNATVKAMLVRHSFSGEYENVSDQKVIKGDYSSFDMLTKAIVGGEVGVKKNSWEALVKVELDIKDDSDIKAREKTIALRRGRYSMTYGTQYHWGVTVGKKYLSDEIGDILWVGETLTERDDYLDIGFDFSKECNTTLNLIIGEKIQQGSWKHDDEQLGGAYKETVLGAIVKNQIDEFQIKASYVRVNTAADDGLEDAASKDSIVAGKSQTSMAFGVGYQFTSWMALSFNADFIRKKDGGQYSYNSKLNQERGNIASDVVNEQIMVFILDVDLDDDSGFSAAYNTRSEKLSDGEDSPLVERRVVMAYRTKVANVDIYAQYFHKQLKDTDADAHNIKKYLDQTESQLGVGLAYEF